MAAYTWADLPMKPHESLNDKGQIVVDGVHGTLLFPNGWGVSVIRHGKGLPRNSSRGFCEGLYELAVIDRSGELRCDSGITDDTIGWLTEQEVADLMNRVAALPATACSS
jgi:hypothetical protein